jgi:hypothetical protein
MQPDPKRDTTRLPLPSGMWLVALVVGGLAFLVIALRSTDDVRTILLICAGLFVIERTIGDWLADRLGATFGKLAFLVAIGAVSWIVLGTDQGRAAVGALLERTGSSSSSGLQGISVPASTRPAAATSSAPRSSPSSSPAVSAPAPRSTSPAESESDGSAAVSATSGMSAGESGIVTSTALRAIKAGQPPGSMILEAVVSASSERVTGGRVEFALDGRVVATVSLDDSGTGRTTVTGLGAGVFRATARFTGSGRLRASVGSTYVSR